MCCHSSNTRIRPLARRPGLPSLRRINNARELQDCKAATPVPRIPFAKAVWKCYGCREQFNVAVGTVFDDSHIPLNR
jgi:hypothetical protein